MNVSQCISAGVYLPRLYTECYIHREDDSFVPCPPSVVLDDILCDALIERAVSKDNMCRA